MWQDTRTADICKRLEGSAGQNRYQKVVGLPLVPYFSGTKVMWILENVDGVRAAAEAGDAVFGNMDTWVLWNLTGGVEGGRHVTDVTNASRTLLMNLKELAWDAGMMAALDVPRAMLPEIKSSSEVYGNCASDTLKGVPIAGILGDQQAALFGQTCFEAGEAKNTYGTGCFLLANTGERLVFSKAGMLSTVAYKLGDKPAVYGLEGSVAIAGSVVQWLRDKLRIIADASEMNDLVTSVDTNGDCYFVPAFSGLFAPHWRNDARGTICGMTGFLEKAHIARAALESTAFQSYEVLQAMGKDFGEPLKALKVDGGMVVNEFLMQFQSDLLNVPVIRPEVTETTALGAAYAAGLAVGFWTGTDDVKGNWKVSKTWTSGMADEERSRQLAQWSKAVHRTLGWVDHGPSDDSASAAAGAGAASIDVRSLAVGALAGAVAAALAFTLARRS